jgi:hypothetical protein
MNDGVEAAVRENQGRATGTSRAAGDGRDGEKEDEAASGKGRGLKTEGEREDDVLLELLGLDGDEGGRRGGGEGGREAEDEEGELALLDRNAREF